MGIKCVFFDLDGTLLPMDHKLFSIKYFELITKKLAPYGYSGADIVGSIQNGIEAMVKNNGETTNENVCWRELIKGLGEGILDHRDAFDDFYINDFDNLKASCGYDARVQGIISYIRSKGIKTVLATNPLFPSMATEKRMTWAGLNRDDFEYVSVYENSSFSKPNPKYYEEILKKLNLDADDCLMVGNDVEEDMIAENAGIKTFLVTDQLISRKSSDISSYRHGDLDDLIEYIKTSI